jgi:hypothetical protein
MPLNVTEGLDGGFISIDEVIPAQQVLFFNVLCHVALSRARVPRTARLLRSCGSPAALPLLWCRQEGLEAFLRRVLGLDPGEYRERVEICRTYAVADQKKAFSAVLTQELILRTKQ